MSYLFKPVCHGQAVFLRLNYTGPCYKQQGRLASNLDVTYSYGSHSNCCWRMNFSIFQVLRGINAYGIILGFDDLDTVTFLENTQLFKPFGLLKVRGLQVLECK